MAGIAALPLLTALLVLLEAPASYAGTVSHDQDLQPITVSPQEHHAAYKAAPRHQPNEKWLQQLKQLHQQQHQQEAAAGDDYEWEEDSPAAADSGPAGKDCAPGCEERGNCNRELGSCECPWGYAGATCNETLMPACRVAPQATYLPCGTYFPKACQCLRQCDAHIFCARAGGQCEMGRDKFGVACWEGEGQVLSDVPEGDARKALWLYQGYDDRLPRTNLTDWDAGMKLPFRNDGARARPLGACPDSCHLQGNCAQLPGQLPFCICHYGYKGASCGEADESTCVNGCQGNGTCEAAFCHCKNGFWGHDCSRSEVYSPGSTKRRATKLKIYAYELPPDVAFQFEYFVGWHDHDSIYTAYQQFMARLYTDWEHRTENPYEANMFYVPALSYAYTANLGDVPEHLRHVMRYIRNAYPFFNRTMGADHFLWLTNDRGACYIPENEPEIANPIKIVHYGWHHQQSSLSPWGCFHPLRDIVGTPYWAGQGSQARTTHGDPSIGLNGTFDPEAIPKGHLLLFAGGIRHHQPDYSNGVRQALHKMYKDGQDPDVLIHEGWRQDYNQLIANAKFCLAPSGHGWGIRLMQYMVLGCVPVIIQDDVYQPYHEVLPYEDFSIRIPKSRIAHLTAVLRAISDEDYRDLRRSISKYWPAFVWDKTIGGKAYEYTLASLKRRLYELQARHYHAPHHITHQPH